MTAPSPVGQAADDLTLPVALVDHEGAVVWRNAAWSELDPITGVPFIWPFEFGGRMRQVLETRAGAVLRSIAHRERSHVYDLWLSPVDGQDRQIWVVAADVTVYEQTALQDMVERRIREASVMIQGILHETRNPLAGIKATVQLLQRNRYRDPERHLQQMLSDISRIDLVLQELTLLAGPLRLHTRRSNLHEVLDEAIANLHGLADERDVRIERRYDPSLPELEVDPHRMYRVYLNLLRNAVEVSPAGGTVVVITGLQVGRRTLRKVWATNILDEGQGIGEEQRQLLFTPLFTTKPAGTGLGLAVSQQIVQAHGGVLTLANREDAIGAVARVEMPLERRVEVD